MFNSKAFRYSDLFQALFGAQVVRYCLLCPYWNCGFRRRHWFSQRLARAHSYRPAGSLLHFAAAQITRSRLAVIKSSIFSS